MLTTACILSSQLNPVRQESKSSECNLRAAAIIEYALHDSKWKTKQQKLNTISTTLAPRHIVSCKRFPTTQPYTVHHPSFSLCTTQNVLCTQANQPTNKDTGVSNHHTENRPLHVAYRSGISSPNFHCFTSFRCCHIICLCVTPTSTSHKHISLQWRDGRRDVNFYFPTLPTNFIVCFFMQSHWLFQVNSSPQNPQILHISVTST